jgi:hypothetical protein
MPKVDPVLRALEDKWRRLKQVENRAMLPGPTKKKAKGRVPKMQDTFARNLAGIPGGKGGIGYLKMCGAAKTGAVTRKTDIGLLRSAFNANTTQGSQVTCRVEDETGQVVSNAQGRVAW